MGRELKQCEQHGNHQYLHRAIKRYAFHQISHGTVLSLVLGQQLKEEALGPSDVADRHHHDLEFHAHYLNCSASTD
jgi:hypothetical protein